MQIVEEPAVEGSHNCKNYMTDGGDTLVIGGTLVVESGAMVMGLPLDFASVNSTGVIYQVENQRASTATDVATLVNDLNALLEKLKNAGAMEEDPAVNA
ncbi:hypothetical protein SDC9_101973 [bioreactor metagenome]|uniref:Head fiber protein n=1 Tax=bioreactor metagenome TaxID=1076179 RepID=A0A645AQ00_9ZZZZ